MCDLTPMSSATRRRRTGDSIRSLEKEHCRAEAQRSPRWRSLLDRPVHLRPGAQQGVLRRAVRLDRRRPRSGLRRLHQLPEGRRARRRLHAERRLAGSPTSGPSTWPPPTSRRPWTPSTANGGQVYVPPMDVTDLGAMAVFGDAGGAAHRRLAARHVHRASAWSPSPARRRGSSSTPATTTPAVGFYRTVFGWDTHVMGDTPEFRYTTLGKDDDQQAGIMDASGFLPEGVPGALVGLLRRRGHRRRPGEGRRARRRDGAPGRGHAVRPAGPGVGPDRRPLQARRRDGVLARAAGLAAPRQGEVAGRQREAEPAIDLVGQRREQVAGDLDDGAAASRTAGGGGRGRRGGTRRRRARGSPGRRRRAARGRRGSGRSSTGARRGARPAPRWRRPRR